MSYLEHEAPRKQRERQEAREADRTRKYIQDVIRDLKRDLSFLTEELEDAGLISSEQIKDFEAVVTDALNGVTP